MSHSAHILLVEPDDTLRFTMEKQIAYFGFSVQSITSVDELRSVEEAQAVLVISLGEEEGNAAMAVSEFKFRLGHIPILFLSAKSNFETRLQVVRLGGTAFLQKPAAIQRGGDFFIHPVDTDHLVTFLMARIRRT